MDLISKNCFQVQPNRNVQCRSVFFRAVINFYSSAQGTIQTWKNCLKFFGT
jgi:hypothetical protein